MKPKASKTIFTAIKSISGRTVTGIASVFGNVDDAGDRILPGAFAKTLAESSKRVRHLWQHGADGWDYGVTPPVATINHMHEVGRSALPGALLEAYPDATGGLEVTRTYLPTERGNEILACYQAGIPLEMSIGFSVVQSKRIATKEQIAPGHIRDLLEVRLFDTSDVNWGMNAATVGAKSVEQRLTLLTERLLLLKPEELAALPEPLQLAFRAACAKFYPQPTPAESRAEPAPARISLTPSLTRLRELELALLG